MPSTKPLPDGIEVFRAGTRKADNGRTYTITQDDIAASAAAYSSALHEAPLTIGHPASNLPAYGWVGGLQARGDVLVTSEHRDVEPAFAEMVRTRRFPKRSASFYAPDDPENPKPGVWYLRHVGYLGAQPPAVKGLKDIQFSESVRAVSFSEANPNQEQHMPTVEELQAQLKAANDARQKAEADAVTANTLLSTTQTELATAKTQIVGFAEASKAAAHAQNASFAEGQVKEGRLLPKELATLVAVLDSLANSEPVSFSEGSATHKVSPVEFVKSLITNTAPRVDFSERAGGHGGNGAELAVKGDSDAVVDQKAKAYALHNKVSYAEALTAVTAAFTV